MTKRSGHAREIAAGCGDYDVIASFGGDGTASDVLSGIMERDGPRPAMAIFTGGTTNIMAHNLGVKNIEDGVRLLRDGHTRDFDIMRVDCHINGRPVYKYSFLACNAGFAAISYKMLGPWMERLFGAKIGAYLRAIAGMIIYRPTRMTVQHEGREYSDYTKAILIGNTEWILKNNVRTTPGADTDGGQLNVTIIPAQTKIRDFSNISKIATGGGIKEKGVLYFLTKKSRIESHPPADLAIDGEFFGTTPAVVTHCPRAIRVISPG